MSSVDHEASPVVRRPPRGPLTMRNSGWFAAALLAVTLFAFWPTYVGKLPARMDLYTHIHAALMTAWFGLLIAQPFLIRRELRSLHRALGRASYVLVPAIAISWILLIHARAAAMPDGVFAREGKFFYLPFVSSVIFVAAYAMAIARRKVTPMHARYMVCTGLAVIDAVLARLIFFNFPPLGNPLIYQVIGFGVTDLAVALLFAIDRGPHRRAFLHVLAVWVPLHLLWFTAGQTAAWLAFVRWFRGLPLT
jgi:hypothetical protein